MKHKAAYFRFLGVIEMIGFIVGFVASLIYVIGFAGAGGFWALFFGIIALIVLLIFGPSFAFLLFGHADLLETIFPEENNVIVPVSTYSNARAYKPSTSQNTMSPLKRATLLSQYEEKLKKKEITREEYNKLVSDLDNKQTTHL